MKRPLYFFATGDARKRDTMATPRPPLAPVSMSVPIGLAIGGETALGTRGRQIGNSERVIVREM